MDFVSHATALDEGGGVRRYTEGDPAAGTPATVLPATQMNAIEAELLAVIGAAGLAPDANDWGQLLQALTRMYQPRIAVLWGELPPGQNEGVFSAGDWRTRLINTSHQYNVPVPYGTAAGLLDNQFQLSAGDWWIRGRAPAEQVDSHRARLYNVTNANSPLIGCTTQCVGVDNGDQVMTDSIFEGVITLSTDCVFELQHRCTLSGSIGFGFGYDLGVNEIYSQITCWKLL